MSPAAADHVVMVIFGILLGVILQLIQRISAIDRSRRPTGDQPRRPFRERVLEIFDRDRVRAENQARLKSMPRFMGIAMIAFYGLIAMLVIVVKVSPVTMRWWPFTGSVLAAFMIASAIFSRAASASRHKASDLLAGPHRP
jgi:hypothetical protein